MLGGDDDEAMKRPAVEGKEFDKVLRAMLTTKPLSKEAISASIRAGRKARQKDKQLGRSKKG
jgi:hypothetical protein